MKSATSSAMTFETPMNSPVDEGISNDALNNNEKVSFVVKMCIFYVSIAAIRIGSWALAYTNILKTLEGMNHRLELIETKIEKKGE